MVKQPFRSFDILIMVVVLGILLTVLTVTTSGKQQITPRTVQRRQTLQNKQVLKGAELAAFLTNNHVDNTRICGLPDLDNILIERVPGTTGNRLVRDYLSNRLKDFGWNVEFDTFKKHTIIGEVEFSNIIAKSTPNAEKYVVLTAHYDSKKFPPQANGEVFLGAIDSAVPCAMILNMLDNLNQLLLQKHTQDKSLGLVVVFFDGEEAFDKWTSTDSVYGSTHLAEKWFKDGFLNRIDIFVLLDLIGAKDPTFTSSFSQTKHHFVRMSEIEMEGSELMEGEGNTRYFNSRNSMWGIEDDHKPFQKKGLKNIVHIIDTPFPHQWHKLSDNAENLHCASIRNVQRILQAWLAEHMGLHKVVNM